MNNNINIPVSGDDLRMARIIYGFETQEDLAKELKVSIGTVQRYESLPEVDAKVLGVYQLELGFEIGLVRDTVFRLRNNRRNHLTTSSL